MKKLILFLLLVTGLFVKSQITYPTNGAPHSLHITYAFINGVIHVNEETIYKNGLLLIKDGKILSASENGNAPKNAVVVDLKGKHVYPSFIDLYSAYGMPENAKEKRNRTNGPQMTSKVKGAFGWNQSINADFSADEVFTHDKNQANELRKIGIGCVLTNKHDGISRGSGALVLLNSTKENESIVIGKCAGLYSIDKGSSTQDYPSSLTGAIALLRQTYYDAQWYKQNGNQKEYNLSLDYFNQLQALPSIFESNDKFNNQRAAKIGKEFNVNYILKTGTNDYQRIEDLKALNLNCIVPVNFPENYDVEDAFEASKISLVDLKHWELAPSNLAQFEKNTIQFCITSADLKDKKQFLINIRKAIKNGLSEKSALKALTTNPAQFINATNKIGALKTNLIANFFISDKNIFEDDAQILESWVAGEAFTFTDLYAHDVLGNYELSLQSKTYKVQISGTNTQPKAIITIDTTKTKAQFTFNNSIASLLFEQDSAKFIRINFIYNPSAKQFSGNAQLADGSNSACVMNYKSPLDTFAKKKTVPKKETELGRVIFPFNAYGLSLKETEKDYKTFLANEKSKTVLIKNVTIWTNEKDSIITNGDVLIVNGKISKVGTAIDASKTKGLLIIDGKGKHLTPGIIDEHSHIALTSGVNEGTQASSAEVRMGDVLNPEDINIYRQLAGGVTCSQLLHGSANPIGGQSALIKLKWGENADGLKFANADGFIKFALGENVKQSNWGDFNSVRFPQSRMGVEQVFYDYFTRAKEYTLEWSNFSKANPKDIQSKKINAPRKDLELEAIAEILNNKRFITCHSYVQSEINMLMHVADSFQFKVNTFTHILEGYKVADKMKAHGVNASTFADWWAYKNEVMEAIPYNAAILTKVGVNTAINSDDAEMARRLNQEAAKSIKYGDLTEVEALKLVTLNPAKMLHVDSKVGSIKEGKDADLVLWSDNPLSIYAKVEKTMIEGVIYFDREMNEILINYNRTERARIITKLLSEKHSGAAVVKHKSKKHQLYHCNTLEGVNEEETGKR